MFNADDICEGQIWVESCTAAWKTAKEAAAMKIWNSLGFQGILYGVMIYVNTMQRMQLSVHRTNSVI